MADGVDPRDPAGDATTRPPPTRVLKVEVRASPGAVDQAVHEAQATAQDDESWRDWLARLERGTAVIARLRTRLHFEHDGAVEQVEVVNAGVWLERADHPPQVLEQIREIAYKDVSVLTAKVRAAGARVDEEELEAMYVDVELDADLRRLLDGG